MTYTAVRTSARTADARGDAAETVRALLTDIVRTEAVDGRPLRDCGLDSIAAARLRVELQSHFGVLLTMSELANSTGPDDLTRLLHDRAGSAVEPTGEAAPTAAPDARFEPFELTAVQESYLLGKDPDLCGDPIGCHLYREFEVVGLDTERLRNAWQRVIDEQDMLRTVVTADQRQQVLRQLPDWCLHVHEVSATEAATRVREVRERLSHQCYDAEQWPLFAIEVSAADSGTATVHFSLDALVTDGNGLDRLLETWWRHYEHPESAAVDAALRPRDCLNWLATETDPEQRRADLEHWTQRLENLPPGPDLLTDLAARETCHRRSALDWAIDAQRTEALRRQADDLGVSVTSLVLAFFAETMRWHQTQVLRSDQTPPFSLVLTTNHRSRFPVDVSDVVAPFTSTAVLVVDDDTGVGVAETARALHERLWEDLDHGAASALDALRQLPRGQGDQPLPVVFTSLLDGGRDVPRGSFGDAVTYSVSQTSNVAVDCQVWSAGDRLHLHWDVAHTMMPIGVGELLFAHFVNAVAMGAPDGATRPLNDLQQAYHVAGVEQSDWDGCQVYQAIEVDDLDVDRLGDVWAQLLADVEPLRSAVTCDGEIAVNDTPCAGWRVPVVDVPDGTSADYETPLAQDLVSHAFPFDTWPQFDLRVTSRAGAPSVVHLTLSLLLLDGRSTHLVARELLRRYADEQAAPIPVETQGAAQNDDTEAATAHWRQRIEALPSGPSLPGAVAESSARTRRDATVPGWHALRARIEAAGLTPDAVLMAALAQALSADFDDPFAMTLVRWTAHSERERPGEHTALSWLPSDSAAELWQLARRYQDIIDDDGAADAVNGLVELRRAVLKRRNSDPISYPVVHTGLLELADRPLPTGARLAGWLTCTPDVSMDCIAMDVGDDELRVYWDTVDDHFNEGQPNQIFQRYLQILAEASGQGDQPAGLNAAETDTILRAWNDTERPYRADGPVHLLFEQRAQQAPDAVALRWRDGTMTYRDLNRHANAIAVRLAGLDLPAEAVVGISARRGPDMVAAVFGILKAGAAYLPVDPHLPADRALGMLADAGAVAVLTTAGDVSWDPQLPVVEVDVDTEVAEYRAGSSADIDPCPRIDADSLAYIIYTSGSTGKPKGVAVTHRPLHNLLQWAARLFSFGPDDVGLCVTSLGFDLSVFDILGLLGFGASLYIADSTEQNDPGLLLDVLLEQGITFWNSAPTTLNQVAPLFPDRGADGTAALRLVFLSGDATPLPLPDQVRATFENARLISLGGATEATVWSNYFPVIDVDPNWRSIPYGRPIDNCRYYILDGERRPCRPGQDGDLYIAGACLSQGYVNRPELTAERFVPDPFAADERMYCTGDRAAYANDGTIMFLGRLDNQVKIRGFRVELGEIEHRLRQHPAVRDAVVLARNDPSGDRMLVAYVQGNGTRPEVSELRGHAGASLPGYMVPSRVVFVEDFPATPNGKLDRDALPEPDAIVEESVEESPVSEQVDPEPTVDSEPDVNRTPKGDQTPEQPPGALRDEVAELFGSHIGIDDIDPQADLWDQGATSFTMVRVSAALKKRYAKRIPVATLLDDPTIDGITRAVAEIVGVSATDPATAETEPASQPGEAEPPVTKEPAASDDGPGQVDLLDDEQRDAFHQQQWNRRRAESDADVVALPTGSSRSADYDRQAVCRDFADTPVDLAALSRLLELLQPDDLDRPRYLYPSAGRTYAVQVYLHVRPDGVTGLDAGSYYYRPDDHALELIEANSGIDRKAHFFYNRELYDDAAFQLFLIGQTHGIEPLYGPDADLFLAVEAGYMGQLLLSEQSRSGIGLCPIGTVSYDRIRTHLGLDDGHRFLHAFLGGVPATNKAAARTPQGAGQQARHAHDVPPDSGAAVIGISGRYPGCLDLDDYWRLLTERGNSFADLPRRPGFPDDADAPLGGYLDAIDQFDGLRFGISPAEASTVDPQVGLVLDAVWRCIEDAGYPPQALAGSERVGVFVASMWPDHQVVGADTWRAGEPALRSGIAADLPNRISHAFGFRGASVAVNTSCSSSLTALHLARTALRRGEITVAVVAGVNLIGHPHHLAMLRDLDLLAAEPAAAFDANATGWTPGEGVGAVLLKCPTRAANDRDPVHGIIEHSWVGHVGTSQRFGAPRAESLGDCLIQGLRAGDLDSAEIDYVECAAAGAAIADAAEIEAVAEAFAGRDKPLLVGTVKPNIGHLEAASGMSQLTKVLLQLRKGRIAPTIVADEQNPLLTWDDAVLKVVRDGAEWPRRDRPGRALINGLGATGSYAHVVVRGATEGTQT